MGYISSAGRSRGNPSRLKRNGTGYGTLTDSTPAGCCAALLNLSDAIVSLCGGCQALESILFPFTGRIPNPTWFHCKALSGMLWGDCHVQFQGDVLMICRTLQKLEGLILVSDMFVSRENETDVAVWVEGNCTLVLRFRNAAEATAFEAEALKAAKLWEQTEGSASQAVERRAKMLMAYSTEEPRYIPQPKSAHKKAPAPIHTEPPVEVEKPAPILHEHLGFGSTAPTGRSPAQVPKAKHEGVPPPSLAKISDVERTPSVPASVCEVLAFEVETAYPIESPVVVKDMSTNGILTWSAGEVSISDEATTLPSSCDAISPSELFSCESVVDACPVSPSQQSASSMSSSKWQQIAFAQKLKKLEAHMETMTDSGSTSSKPGRTSPVSESTRSLVSAEAPLHRRSTGNIQAVGKQQPAEAAAKRQAKSVGRQRSGGIAWQIPSAAASRAEARLESRRSATSAQRSITPSTTASTTSRPRTASPKMSLLKKPMRGGQIVQVEHSVELSSNDIKASTVELLSQSRLAGRPSELFYSRNKD